jgi:hypothetical protein
VGAKGLLDSGPVPIDGSKSAASCVVLVRPGNRRASRLAGWTLALIIMDSFDGLDVSGKRGECGREVSGGSGLESVFWV